MDLNFKPIEAGDIEAISKYFCRRPNKTCDSVCLDSFLWRDYYHVQFAVSDGKALQWLMEEDGVKHSAMPMCTQEELPHYFYEMVDYFNKVLKLPFKVYLADEEAVEYLHLRESDDFEVVEQEDLKDYLYEGEALRTLAGKKLHKKKNHLNSFLKEYEGRYEYRRMGCSDRESVWKFLDRWRADKGEDAEVHLDYEVHGIHDLLKHCCEIGTLRMAGVFVDGELEAFTIGSYNPYENMAVIHIEKANAEIRGLYQFINQQFLINEFPDAQLVNREDDLGQEGLRRAKESYYPCGYARKYLVLQKNFDPEERKETGYDKISGGKGEG
ncbi:MAG: phosphatidylglycerol lysyltransferase domain-containing protein [Clostridiales bacterium]|nr:phosphatidylglycerol lysyltransferase domain-containing protein [Clostridiales bacterium]